MTASWLSHITKIHWCGVSGDSDIHDIHDSSYVCGQLYSELLPLFVQLRRSERSVKYLVCMLLMLVSEV